MNLTLDTQYLTSHQLANHGKTERWNIVAKSSGQTLGYVRWHGAWRQYVFTPNDFTLFNAGCLDDISGFLREANRLQRQQRQATPA